MDGPLIIAALIVAAAIFFGAVLAAFVRTFGEYPAAVGRFQLGVGPGGQDQILDTKTGRLWERAGGAAEWVEVAAPWRLKRGKS
jgi:hypothetical protein